MGRPLLDTDYPTRSRVSISLAAARAIALFLGVFTFINLIGEMRHIGFDASLWWIDLRLLIQPLNLAVLLLTAVLLTAFALRPVMSRDRRRITLVLLLVLIGIVAGNAMTVFYLMIVGEVRFGFPVPFSLFVLVALLILLGPIVRQTIPPPGGTHRFALVAIFIVCLVAFPLLQMFCFGKTN